MKAFSRASRMSGLLFILFTAVALAPSEASAQTLTTLHPFGSSSTDGQDPYAGLIAKAGNFYGTTYVGGVNGYGTVFELTPSGSEAVVYSFGSSSTDGQYPAAGLITDASGNLYGTTTSGGTSNLGTVFKLTPSGTETVLHSFSGFPNDGAYPYAGLIADASGNFYSTTYQGGAANGGTVFEVTPSGTETVLYSFGGSNGIDPQAGLIFDASGNLYGTTVTGGENSNGTVSKLMNQNGTWTETVLYSFGPSTGTDAMYPRASLIADVSGNLYSTTLFGGENGGGTVFKVTPWGTETVLYSFTGGKDGMYPIAGLIADASGNLYGTNSQAGADGAGTAFKLTGAGFELGAAFSITPTPSTETVYRGRLAGFLLTLKSLYGFEGKVTLSCSGGPAGSYCADLPQTVNLNGTAYAVSGILFPRNSAPGTYTIKFTGTSGAITEDATTTFIVK